MMKVSEYKLYLDGNLGNVLFELAHAYSCKQDDQRLVCYAVSSQLAFIRQVKKAFDLSFNIQYTTYSNIKRNFQGYFQSEKHFNTEKIRKLFQFTKQYKQQAKMFFDELHIKPEDCVAMTVRRGDYVTLDGIWIAQPDEYYKQSFNKFFNNKQCIISSDDIQYVKSNFNSISDIVVNEHTSNVLLILCILSQLKHHIGSSSTFSWWAAWLNEQKDSKIIFPNKWYDLSKLKNNQQIPKEDIDDILPERWIKFKPNQSHQAGLAS